MSDQDLYTAKLTPLEQKGLQTVNKFGADIYKAAQEEFERIDYNGTVNDQQVKNKITKWIAVLDGTSITTLNDITSANSVETFGTIDEALKENQITAEMVVAAILIDHESYPTHREISHEIASGETNGETNSTEDTDAETVFKLIRALRNCAPNT